MVVLDVFTPRLIGFGIARGDPDGCRCMPDVQSRHFTKDIAKVRVHGQRSPLPLSLMVGEFARPWH